MIHSNQIKLLIKLGLTDKEIKSTLRSIELKKGTAPISYRQLSDMDDFERSKLLSIYWTKGQYITHCIGIDDTRIDYRQESFHILRYGDQNGDVKIYFESSTDLIDRVGQGDYTYGLYKRLINY